jgi:hypothetical protein
MVYLDRHVWKGRELSHVVADDLDELHSFMSSLPCVRKRFHNKPFQPHYDLDGSCIELAIELGAQLVSTRRIVEILRLRYSIQQKATDRELPNDRVF